MIKTRNMAEAVRPRPRNRKEKFKKDKPQAEREPSPLSSAFPSTKPATTSDRLEEAATPSRSDSRHHDKADKSPTSNAEVTSPVQKQAVVRPQTLPDLTPNAGAQSEGSAQSQRETNQSQTEVASLATYLEKHKQERQDNSPKMGHKQYSSASPKTDPKHSNVLAVVEDPDTPMARAASPAVSRQTSPEDAKPLPASLATVVQEEKSPTLLAQEALARMQVMASSLAQQAQTDSGDVVSGHENQLQEGPKERNVLSDVTETCTTTVEMQSQARGVVERIAIPATQPALAMRAQLPASVGEVEAPKKKVAAMALKELLSLYYNPELAVNEKFIEDFVQREMKRDNHEFAEILSGYLRARHELISVEDDLSALQKNYKSLQNELWITHTRSFVLSGRCADQVSVNATHTYEQCELHKEAVGQMSGVLENIRSRTGDNLALYSYLAQISKLQVESYIHDLYLNHPALRDVPKNAGVPVSKQLTADEQYQVNKLKECITILFTFHRKPTNDEIFIESIRTWTVRLVSTLLRLATFSDHLFILNHLLRCPAGVGKWATKLIQIPTVGTAISGPFEAGLLSESLSHFITAMATVLLPIRAREDFMTQMRVSFSPESLQEDRAWIMIDSDGEEDEDPANAWLYLHENDVVAFLGQFPLSEFFSRILMASISDTGQVDYDIRRCTEPMMIKLFAFSTILIQLLGRGLETYSMSRYRQLNKRVGRLIRQTVSFVSDHWLNFKMHYEPMVSEVGMERLQVEFDQLFMRAIHTILTAQKLGSWQFMAEMPYTCVSIDSMWQLLWLLHQGQEQEVDLDSLPSVEACRGYLHDPDSWQQLADGLMQSTTSEAIYLLTTFSNMACRRSFSEQDFIHLITLEVFEVAYMCNHTREFCNKVGRDLLSSIIQTHPSALSFLLCRVKDVITKLGKMALYLFSDLPVSIWQPTDPDMLILRQWLLNFDQLSTENRLSRIIFSKMNWDVFEQTGRPVLDVRLHRQMALLLVEAYTRFIVDRKAGFFILEGMRQMASYVTAHVSPEQALNNWVWDLALKLKLHQQCGMWHASGSVDPNFQAPDLGAENWLLPLLKGVTNKTPIACFVALTMTNIGHDTTAFLSEGIDLLTVLTSNHQYTTAIYILGCVVPIFIREPQLLLENEGFIKILDSIVVADESLFKSTKSTVMNVEFPGVVIGQLTEMIQAQISSHLAQGTAELFISFWVHAIFKVCKFFSDKNCCYIMDSLINWTLVKKGVKETLMDIFRQNYMQFCQMCKQRQGIVSSMISWLAASNNTPSYLDSPWLSQFPWLAYVIITMEGDSEVASGLWQTLIIDLHHSRRPTVDNALKSAAATLDIDQFPATGKLTIYRWAQQAIDMPLDHPLLPLIWQRFFGLYLGRQVFESSLANRASAGERFFESMSYSNMLKKMCNRLQETSNFHMNFDPQTVRGPRRNLVPGSPLGSPGLLFNVPGGSGDSEEATAPSSPGEDEESIEYSSSKEFHQMLARLYQTFSLWLEEPRLHDANLYLPALPPQYEGARLNQVFQGFMSEWLEFIDLEGIQYNLSCLAAAWRKRLTSNKSASQAMAERWKTEPKATDRIMRRLRRYDDPQGLPAIANVESVVPLINSAIVEDQSAFMHLVSSDLQLLKHHTEIFSSKLAQHCALDNHYVELIPSLFANRHKTVQLTASCKSTLNPMHRCTSPAVMNAGIDEKERNEITHRKIEENRVEYKQLMIEFRLPTPLNICIAAVHTENAITRLIKLSQKAFDQSRAKKLRDTAYCLFYHMASMVSEESDLYPPTKQFFASCIDILGQEFISRDADQVVTVLQLCLDKPFVSGLISPHFIPNLCPGQLVHMYSQLLHVLQSQNMDLVFMLLTKFDIGKWLGSSNPSEADKKLMIEALGSSLMACGIKPPVESELVFELYISHFRAVLQSNFPSNLFMVLDMVCQGSASEGLHVRVWQVLLSVAFSDNFNSVEEFTKEKIESCNDLRLSTVQLTELLEWIGTYFMQIRMSDPKALSFGLYIWWARYVPYTSLMLGACVRSFVTKILNSSEAMSPYQVMEILWKPFISVFAPWIQPVCTNDVVNAAWVEADNQSADCLVSAFVNCIHFIYQQINVKFPDNASGVLSLLLMHYMTCYSTKVTPAHVVDVLMGQLRSLPWEQVRPDVTLMEIMTKVKEVSSPCCFTLIAHVLPLIKWNEVISFHVTHTPPEVACRMKAALAILLIQAFVDPYWSQDEKIQQLLTQAEGFDWLMLSHESFACVSSWLLQHRDPRCVLAQRSSPLAAGLRLLKQMSGFKPDATWHGVVSTKRMTYIHCVTQLLCQVTYLKDVGVESVKTTIVNLLSDIEAVEMSVPSVEDQKEESCGMLKQVLSLLNNCNPDGGWLDIILSSVTGWFQSSPQSLLLEPCIKSASNSLASLQHMAVILETCIEAYFVGLTEWTVGPSSKPLDGWDFIMSIFTLPELNQAGYVSDALSVNAYLVIYCYLRHKAPFCNSVNDDFGLMEEILSICARSQLCQEDEIKVIMWWHLLLTLAIKHVPANPSGVINVITRFTSYLAPLAHEKDQKGFLGAIGLGSKSPLSKKMRVFALTLMTFIRAQINGIVIRMQPGSPLKAVSLPAKLSNIQKYKLEPSTLKFYYEGLEMISSPMRTFNDSVYLLTQLSQGFFPECTYLTYAFK